MSVATAADRPKTVGQQEPDQELECSICHEVEEDPGQLLSPCNCSGSIRYVHYECIAQWITIKSTNKCSVCNTVYRHIDIRQQKRSLCEYLARQWPVILVSFVVLLFCFYISLISYTHSVVADHFHHIVLSTLTYVPSITLFCVTLGWALVSLEVMRSDFFEWRRTKIRYTAVGRADKKFDKSNKSGNSREIVAQPTPYILDNGLPVV